MGDGAPGTGGGAFIGFGDEMGIADSGGFVLRGNVTGGSVPLGLFSSAGAVALPGQAAPGIPGATYGALENPAISDGGTIAVQTRLNGTGMTSSNNDALVAGLGQPSINNSGAVAFDASLRGGGVTGLNDGGIFLSDGAGGLDLLLREGDTIDVGGGDMRTIRTLSLFREALNDSGEVAFTASFTDGSSGVFAASADAGDGPAAIPLPASVWLMLGGLGALGLLGRRRRS